MRRVLEGRLRAERFTDVIRQPSEDGSLEQARSDGHDTDRVPRELPSGVQARRPVDKCIVAIDENKYSNRPAVRSALMNFVDRERAKNTSEEAIEHKLRNWTNVDAVADDDDDDGDTLTISSK